MCIKSLKYLRRNRRGYFTVVFKNFAYILSNLLLLFQVPRITTSEKVFRMAASTAMREVKTLDESAADKSQFRKGTLNPASIYLLKVNHRNSRKRYEICSKLTMKTPKRFH